MTVSWRHAVFMMSICISMTLPLMWAAADDVVKATDTTAEAMETRAAPQDPVHAGHQDPKGTPPLLQFDMGSAIVNITIFIGVLLILSKFVWPVILGGLEARESKIRTDLESADKANQDAKALLAGYQSKLDEASAKVQAMLAEAHKNGEAAGQRIVDDAKAEAERQRVRAIADIETAKKVAIADLAGQTSDLAMMVARKVLGRELKSEDHADLIRQSLDRMPSNN